MEQTDLFGNVITKNGHDKVISGYRIYDAEQKRRTVRNDLPSLYPDLPEKKLTFEALSKLCMLPMEENQLSPDQI